MSVSKLAPAGIDVTVFLPGSDGQNAELGPGCIEMIHRVRDREQAGIVGKETAVCVSLVSRPDNGRRRGSEDDIEQKIAGFRRVFKKIAEYADAPAAFGADESCVVEAKRGNDEVLLNVGESDIAKNAAKRFDHR